MFTSTPTFIPSPAAMPRRSPWLPGMPPPSPCRLPRLFCFAYAGGTGEVYRQWQGALAGICQVCPVELPGRGSRMAEPFAASLDEAAAAVSAAISPYAEEPYLLFGHSLGSVLALETTRALQKAGLPLPMTLIVSGRYPPWVDTGRRQFHRLPDGAIIDEMRRLGGTPEEVLSHRELLDMILPVVRDDFRLLETHHSAAAPLLHLPVHVFCGREDEDSPPDLLARWQEAALQECTVTLFDGGHFYVNDSRMALLRSLRTLVRRLTPDAVNGGCA